MNIAANQHDTIVAAATPPGRGGVAIVRISGPLVKSVISLTLRRELKPRIATYSHFLDANHQTIDIGIALFFPAPGSFTGEDVLELQGHGGPVIVDCLIQRLLSLDTRIRLARPGEFSERAFLNGKMDLAQAEAVADFINSSSQQAARSALKSLQGDFSKKIQKIVNHVINLRTYIEAAIDFVEEEIDFLADQQIETQLITIANELEWLRQAASQGRLLQEGIQLVIAGPPNVGKSSLLNYLSQKDSAIVADIAGTTRDPIREQILLDGMPIHVVDTAGLHDSQDLIEQEGMRRAKQEMGRADLILWVTDQDHSGFPSEILVNQSIPLIIVHNKIDLIQKNATITEQKGNTLVFISVKTGEGLELLTEHIKKSVGFYANQEGIFSARRRHLDALKIALDFIKEGQNQLFKRNVELLAEDLRQTQNALNQITGEFSADDLLGRIFSSFCIGK